MSIGFSGLDTPCCMPPVTIEVSPTHPLLQLAHVIPWQALAELVLPDLKRATRMLPADVETFLTGVCTELHAAATTLIHQGDAGGWGRDQAPS